MRVEFKSTYNDGERSAGLGERLITQNLLLCNRSETHLLSSHWSKLLQIVYSSLLKGLYLCHG